MHKAAPVIDDARLSLSPLSESEKAEDQVRKRFVGDIDLPESMLACCSLSCWISCPAIGQEPLLMESKRRFVLFPIQYHEVSPLLDCSVS